MTTNRIMKRVVMAVAAAAAVVLVVLAFRPKPVEVETARAVRGPLQVTVDEDGRHARMTVHARRSHCGPPITNRVS